MQLYEKIAKFYAAMQQMISLKRFIVELMKIVNDQTGCVAGWSWIILLYQNLVGDGFMGFSWGLHHPDAIGSLLRFVKI